MAQQGYILLTVDGRGSDHRGIEFENCTFRYLGQEEAKDQLKAAEFLKSLPYVDGDRLGVHGWSFGGYMTINLMLTYPDLFKVGVAGGPVIDWKYYEVMYGERYMDTPEANPEGYKARSLNERAGNLKGRLQIIYGGNDPTCVPQHTLSFIRSSIDHGTHPDLFVYPGQGHNMAGKDRVHLEEHITRYFNDFLK
jgi:dipeptidyl-peptidase-4